MSNIGISQQVFYANNTNIRMTFRFHSQFASKFDSNIYCNYVSSFLTFSQSINIFNTDVLPSLTYFPLVLFTLFPCIDTGISCILRVASEYTFKSYLQCVFGCTNRTRYDLPINLPLITSNKLGIFGIKLDILRFRLLYCSIVRRY